MAVWRASPCNVPPAVVVQARQAPAQALGGPDQRCSAPAAAAPWNQAQSVRARPPFFDTLPTPRGPAASQSKAPPACMACLATYDLKLCKTGLEPLGSCRPRGAPTPCGRCANAARGEAAFSACLACHADPNRDMECGGCSEIPASDEGRGRCYECAHLAGFSSYEHYGCAQCFQSDIDDNVRNECLVCAAARGTPAAAKRFCSACADGSGDRASTGGRRACFSCLQATRAEEAQGTCLGDDVRRRRKLRGRGLYAV